MTGYRHSVLYHNNGNGTFTDVTAKAGVGDDGAWATAAGWFDYDRDGQLDLLVTNYVQFDEDHPVSCGENKPGFARIATRTVFGKFAAALSQQWGRNFCRRDAKSRALEQRREEPGCCARRSEQRRMAGHFYRQRYTAEFLVLNNRDGTFRDVSYTSGRDSAKTASRKRA